MIQRIIIHKSLIDSFKKTAIKALPWEYIVAVLGKMICDDLHVYAFDKINMDSWINDTNESTLHYWQPEEEVEAGSGLKYFGTLHSHPNGTTQPSECDIKDFRKKYNHGDYTDEEGFIGEELCDEIMGIMQVAKKKRVIHYGITFYNINLEPIEVIISETRKSNHDHNC
jgi:proteasome lid subunit RPN8/RPN11